MDSHAILYLLFALITVFLALSVILRFVAWIGGWSTLASKYPGKPFPPPKTWRFRSMRMGGWTRYNNVLTIGADETGLTLAMPSLFSAGHDPIFLPWEEMEISPDDGFNLFLPMVKIAMKGCPETTFSLSRDLLARIRKEVGITQAD